VPLADEIRDDVAVAIETAAPGAAGNQMPIEA
jgi:hypothetical protein